VRPGNPLGRVRALSTRVALVSTGIVAAVYLVISVLLTLIVTQRLTSDVDSNLATTLSHATDCLVVPGPCPAVSETGDAPLVWLVDTQGNSYFYYSDYVANRQTTSGPSTLFLPSTEQGATHPQTVSLDGTSYRLAGTGIAGSPPEQFRVFDPSTGAQGIVQFNLARVVVGQSMSSVNTAQSNVMLAEALVGPVLLIAVFLGALTVGRRVAAPIEMARLRQMEFTADASHELRTPLSVIEAQTSLALAEPRDVAWYRAAFQRVQGESGRIRRLVEDLLWLARFDTTRDRAQAEHVDVAILAQMAADRFTAVAEANRIRLTVRTAPQPLVVHAPPEWLDRLLGVLLDNACKYVPTGGAVGVVVWAEGNRIRLSVEDSGPGIPVEERGRIFDRFRRATDQPGGAGLGLAIANSVVNATGGRWHLRDSPAGGMSMGVSWPRSLPGYPAPAGAAPPQEWEMPPPIVGDPAAGRTPG